MQEVTNHKTVRVKQPELVRQRILQHAAELASIQGVSGISIQQVANLAGVSKGAVFHHFANKQQLVEEMVKYIIGLLDMQLEALITNDPEPYGQFTRAYIQISLQQNLQGLNSSWTALALTIATDSTFNQYWKDWLDHKLAKYQQSDQHSQLKLLRLAVDGLWLGSITQVESQASCQYWMQVLLKQSYPSVNVPSVI